MNILLSESNKQQQDLNEVKDDLTALKIAYAILESEQTGKKKKF